MTEAKRWEDVYHWGFGYTRCPYCGDETQWYNPMSQRSIYMEIMCEYDEAFTIQEMLEETGQCKDCKLNCLNAGKSE